MLLELWLHAGFTNSPGLGSDQPDVWEPELLSAWVAQTNQHQAPADDCHMLSEPDASIFDL